MSFFVYIQLYNDKTSPFIAYATKKGDVEGDKPLL